MAGSLLLGSPSVFAFAVSSCPQSTFTDYQSQVLDDHRKVSEINAVAKEIRNVYSSKNALNPTALSDFEDGILNVTTAPYNALPNGSSNVTCALQKVLLDARDAQLVTYLPPGDYRITDQLECIQTVIDQDDVNSGENKNNREDYPCVLRGGTYTTGTTPPRARLVLARSSGGFGDPNRPKPVLFFATRDKEECSTCTTYLLKPSVSFSQMILSLEIDLGVDSDGYTTNTGAIGIDHEGAQGSVIEGVTIMAGTAGKGAFAGCRARGAVWERSA